MCWESSEPKNIENAKTMLENKIKTNDNINWCVYWNIRVQIFQSYESFFASFRSYQITVVTLMADFFSSIYEVVYTQFSIISLRQNIQSREVKNNSPVKSQSSTSSRK